MDQWRSSDDLQVLVDTLVFEARRPNSVRLRELAATLDAGWAMPLGQEEYGLLLRFDDDALNPYMNELDDSRIGQHITPQRLQELTAGEEPSEEELALWRDLNAEDAFENPEGEAWEIVPLESRTGDRAFAAQLLLGDSWSGVDLEFLGVFLTVDAARRAVQAVGYICLEDYQSRYPARPAAKLEADRPQQDLDGDSL